MSNGSLHAFHARASSRAQPEASEALSPLEVLDTDHRQMVVMLAKLGELIAEGCDLSAPPTRALALEVHTFFGEHARRHHADEELHVFPGLFNSVDSSVPPDAMYCARRCPSAAESSMSPAMIVTGYVSIVFHLFTSG